MKSRSAPSAQPVVSLLITLLALLVTVTGLSAQQAGDSPVKIFILAGQSNMEGQGEISPATTPGTLEHTVANDPGGDYQYLVDGGGAWVVRDDVWIRDESPAEGGLTVGWGASSTTIGPELAFGHFIGDLNGQQVLIVKAAWGGKDLAVDFRPPSSGWSVTPPVADGDEGFYYNEVLRLVSEATSNLGTYFPDYDGGGYEIAGFAWHQGWNDRVDVNKSNEYETNMANFIRDMRTDLGVANLPFVIATTGMDGGDAYTVVEQAQLAMANTTFYPEFAGNVAVIDTRSTYEGLEFWQAVEQSPADQGYHWNRNAKTYLHIGQAMADAMSVMAPGRCPFRPRAVGGPTGVTLTWQNGTEIPTSVRVLRNGSEIAAAASANPPTYLDSTALPGVLNYELQFTMVGDPCDPLTVSFDGAITDLVLAPGTGTIDLTWTNAMGYTAIEVRRNGAVIEAALAGTATSYTDSAPPTSGLVTYTVAPTTGTSTPATADINLDLAGQLGVLDLTANDGINPATGLAWAAGDTYRLVFVSSAHTTCESTDIATYNTFVQGLADAAGLGAATWKAVGSTATIDARDNTSANPNEDGDGETVYRMDGTFVLATGYVDLWNGINGSHEEGEPYLSVYLDENGTQKLHERVRTGTNPNGTASSDGRVLGGSAEGRVKTGRNYAPDAYGFYNVNWWMQDWHEAAVSAGPVYGMSAVLTVVDTTDTTAPNLVSIEDDQAGASVVVPNPVVYTVTFDEPMSSGTVDISDFENASATAVTIDSVGATADPAVYEVTVSTVEGGTLQLQIKQGAELLDANGNALVTTSALPDDVTITVIGDATPPTLLWIDDDVAGGPIVATQLMTPVYSITFDEAIDPLTVGADDFENGSSAPMTIDSVSATGDPAVFEVVVTTSGAGDLVLQIKAGAVITDLAGNPLDTTSALPDDTTITVNPAPVLEGELGILDVINANGGINPATGLAWAEGDTYRLVFVTSGNTTCESTDIATYNAFIQGLADAAGHGSTTWKVVGSTASIDAMDNTNTNPTVDGVGEPVLRMDGTFVIANGYNDLWNGINNSHETGQNYLTVYLDENGNERIHERVRTGTTAGGVAATDGRVLGGSAEATPRTQTGRNYAPDFYGGLGGGNWMQDWSETSASSGPVYGMSAVLTVGGGSDTYVDWIGGYPGVGGMTAFTDDPDEDGLANGVESWFGTDPGVFNAGVENLVTNGTTTTSTHPQNTEPPSDVTGSYEWSTNLTDWYDGDGVDGPPSGETVTISAETTGATTTVTATASEGMEKMFLRTKVTQN